MLGSMAPFVAHDVNDVYKKILKSHIKFPGFFSKASRKLILGLLRKKQTRRLGVIAGGAQKIRDHEFFTEAPGWDWTALQVALILWKTQILRENRENDFRIT